jgi:hypothetical protein
MITSNTLLVPRIESRIQVIRGLRVMLDVDLAALYGVQTKRLNEQVTRNRDRFPSDFLFQLTADEKAEVVANCDHLQNLKFSKALPFAFTEHGAIQAANVLASSQAVEMGIYVVRAFVQLRQALAANADIAKRLAELEMKTESLEMSHDNFSRNTRLQLRQLLAEQDKRNAVELAQAKVASAMQKTAVAKDSEIQALKAKLDAGEVSRKLAVTAVLTVVTGKCKQKVPVALMERAQAAIDLRAA